MPIKHKWYLTYKYSFLVQYWYPVHIYYYMHSGLFNNAASHKSRCRSTSLMRKHIWYWSKGQALIGTWNGHTWSSSRAKCPLFACSTKGTADKVSGVFTRAQCSAASSPIPHASLTTPQPVWGQGLWGWWAWADTFLLTITSHGPTFRFPGLLLTAPPRSPGSFPQASHQWLHQTNTLSPQHLHTYMPCRHVHIHVKVHGSCRPQKW